MISQSDILKGKPLASSMMNDLNLLVKKLNDLENLSGIFFSISSGLRNKEDQIRIYKEKGVDDIEKVPMKSKHFFCQAADIVCDNIQSLKNWVLENDETISKMGIYFENFDNTPNWIHVQIVPPNSGKRFFYP